MPLPTIIAKPKRFNAVALANRLLYELGWKEPAEPVQRVAIDAIQAVLDQLVAEGVLK